MTANINTNRMNTNLDGYNSFQNSLGKYNSLQENKNIEESNANARNLDVIDDLIKYGKMKEAELAVSFIKNNDVFSNDLVFLNQISSFYNKSNDFKSALYYSNCIKSRDDDFVTLKESKINPKYYSTILGYRKNNIISKINTGEDINSDLEELRDCEDCNSDILETEMSAENNWVHGNDVQYYHDIMLASFLNKLNNINNTDVSIKEAILHSQSGQYDKSNKICEEQLQNLDNDGIGYTNEYVTLLNTYGINQLSASDGDESEANKAFSVAKKISSKIDDRENLAVANFNLALLAYKNNDENTLQTLFKEFKSDNKELVNAMRFLKINNSLSAGDKTNAEAEYSSISDSTLDSDSNGILNKTVLATLDKYFDKDTITGDRIKKKVENNKELSNKEKLEYFNILNDSLDTDKLLKLSEDFQKSDSGILKLVGETFIRSREYIDNQTKMPKNELNDIQNKLKELDKAKQGKDKIVQRNINKYLYTEYDKLFAKEMDSCQYHNAYKLYEEKVAHSTKDKPDVEKIRDTKTLITTAYMGFITTRDYSDKFSVYNHTKEYLDITLNQGDKYSKTENLLTALKKDNIKERYNVKDIKTIASAVETLGVLEMKDKNLQKAYSAFSFAKDLREHCNDNGAELANTYAGISRIALLKPSIMIEENIRPKELHQKSLDIMKRHINGNNNLKQIYNDELEFHKNMFGANLKSILKYVVTPFQADTMIDKFKFYNGDLGICE